MVLTQAALIVGAQPDIADGLKGERDNMIF
jgi:hypothetical protein